MEIQEIAELAQVSIEEVFYSDPHARAEYEAQCDIWRDEPEVINRLDSIS